MLSSLTLFLNTDNNSKLEQFISDFPTTSAQLTQTKNVVFEQVFEYLNNLN